MIRNKEVRRLLKGTDSFVIATDNGNGICG